MLNDGIQILFQNGEIFCKNFETFKLFTVSLEELSVTQFGDKSFVGGWVHLPVNSKKNLALSNQNDCLTAHLVHILVWVLFVWPHLEPSNLESVTHSSSKFGTYPYVTYVRCVNKNREWNRLKALKLSLKPCWIPAFTLDLNAVPKSSISRSLYTNNQ